MFIYSQKACRGISDNKGISLVAVTIVMVIVSCLALFMASLMSSGNIAAVTNMQSDQAFYIAQAGKEWYLEQLQGDSDWSKTLPAVKTNQAFGPGSFSVTYANNSKNVIDVISTAKVNAWDGNKVQRVIRCRITRSGGVMTTSLWQEAL